MADVTIDDSVDSGLMMGTQPRALVWTDPNNGYLFSVFNGTGGEVLQYRKTEDGGENWAAAISVGGSDSRSWSIWYDQWTDGDTGTKIHIVYLDDVANLLRYRELETATDTLSSSFTISAESTGSAGTFTESCISIVKTRGGNFIAGGYFDNAGTTRHGIFRSTAPLTSWTETDNPLVDSLNPVDYLMFTPGNETADDDIWMMYWDRSANTIEMYVYDWSDDSWSGATEIDAAANHTVVLAQMDCAHRLSDKHTILIFWNALDSGSGDLKVYDIGGTGDIVGSPTLDDVIENTADAVQCAILINQQNDHIAVSYLLGSAYTSSLGAKYKISTDDGVSWGSEVDLSIDSDDDLRWITGGTSVSDDGGRFGPCWFNDDLNDLITNIDTTIEIPATSGSTPVSRIFNIRHDISQEVGRAFNIRSDILVFVNRAFNLRHNIFILVNRQFNIRSDILNLVSRQFNIRHNIAQLVSREFNLRHDLAGVVNRAFNLRHNIAQFVNRNFVVRHDILNLVNRNFSIRHDISQLVSRNFNLRHDLAGSVSRIFDLRHDLAGSVGRTFNIRSNILNLVNRTFAIRHNVLNLISRQFNVRHNIAQLVNRSFNIRHDILQFVSRIFNFRHDIAGDPTALQIIGITKVKMLRSTTKVKLLRSITKTNLLRMKTKVKI